MSKKQKTDAKKIMLPHSRAKLDYYQSYLQVYLPILRLAKFTQCINIFDIFCGTGIYEDGTKGSPVRAFEAIKESTKNHNDKELAPVNLIINDIEKDKVEGIKKYLDKKNSKIKTCDISYNNFDVNDFLVDIKKRISKQSTKQRNLILIDPYGYKVIKKKNIERLLTVKRNTEIILFLPISQIYRFMDKALSEDDTNVKTLKEFIKSFFPDDSHPIYNKNVTCEKDLIEYIREALTFNNKFFATSYFIQRDKRQHYYALFSITPNIYGLEKNLAVKWKLNEESGGGFELPKLHRGLFDDHFKQEAIQKQYNKLKTSLLEFIEKHGSVNNNQLYEFTLRNMFLPKHSNLVLKQLQKEKVIEVTDAETLEIVERSAFYQNYNNYTNDIIKIKITKSK